jgi:RNA polymerase sigma-70 factor (ECF subfamily)
LCRRITGSDADGDDATQEALIAIVRGIAHFDGRSTFGTWAYRVATNASLDERRRRARRAEPVEDDALASAHAPAPSTDVASTAAVRVDIDVALQALPADFRAAVVLRDLCGLDYAEIAEVLDVPTGTVKSRIARGRALLADILGGNPAPAAERQTP